MKSLTTKSHEHDTRKLVCFYLALVACGFVIHSFFALTTAQAQQQHAAQNGVAAAHEDTLALLRAAIELLEAGRLDEAEPLLRRATTAAPANADAHSLLGALLDQRGRADEAEREYQTALRLNPRHISARANLGVLLARTGRAAEAIKLF